MAKTHIDKYIDYLLGEGVAKGTIRVYTKAVEQFLTAIGKSNPEDLTEDDIQKYKTWCNTKGNNGKPFDKNSLIPKYSGVKIFITEVLKKPESWKKRLKTSSVEVKPKELLTEDEIKRLFSASKHDKRDNAILRTLYFTTIRRSELQNLNIEDIDFENETITTWNGKGGHHDVRNIHPIALKSINEYLKIRYVSPKPYRRKGEKKQDYENRLNDVQKALFLNRAGTQRLGITDVHYLLRRYGAIAGIKKRLYPHLLRGSSATHMSNAGMSLVEIQAQTKHRSLETLTKHYINPSKERVKKVYTEVFNQFSDEQIPKPQPEIKPMPEPQPKSQPEDDKTDKYIALLEKGLIGREDFLKLMTSENKQANLVGYM